MSRGNMTSRRRFIILGVSAAAGTALLAACQPQTVEVTKVIEKPVEVTRVVVATSAPQSAGTKTIIYHNDWYGESGGRVKFLGRAMDSFHQNNKARIYTVAGYCEMDRFVAADVVPDAYRDACRGKPENLMAVWEDQAALLKARNYDWSDYLKMAIEECQMGGSSTPYRSRAVTPTGWSTRP